MIKITDFFRVILQINEEKKTDIIMTHDYDMYIISWKQSNCKQGSSINIFDTTLNPICTLILL